jgi:nickel-dependent lactate racemase
MKELNEIAPGNLRFLVGSGSHRIPTEEDLNKIFGAHLDEIRPGLHLHHAKDDSKLVDFGTTSRGTVVRLDEQVAWADRMVVIGSVEPHYFAGLTGGRKWVIGAGAFSMLEMNHKHALKDEAKTLVLEGNPVHEDLVEIQALANKMIFSIQCMVDQEGRVATCLAGDVDSTFATAASMATGFFCSDIKRLADIVVTVARDPLDNNLYQAMKAIENGKLAIEDGGIIILVAACGSGIGPEHFIEMVSGTTREKLQLQVKQHYKLGLHKIAKFLNLLEKAKIWLVSTLDSSVLEGLGMRFFGDPQEALNAAIQEKGPEAHVALLPDGGSIVPYLCK